MNGHQPNRVDSEFFEIVELGSDPVEVADPVVVCVVEAADENFVEDGIVPPVVWRYFFNGRRHRFNGSRCRDRSASSDDRKREDGEDEKMFFHGEQVEGFNPKMKETILKCSKGICNPRWIANPARA